MRIRLLTATIAVAVLSILGITTAGATIIGASPNTNFANSSTNFMIGNAQYTFSNNAQASNPLSVATGGSAQVSLFGTPPNVPHKPGGVGGVGQSLPTFSNIFGTTSYAYDSFPDATPSPSFGFFGPYLGLKFTLDDGIHYGFAKITDSNTLVDYAYNSVAGAGITTGASIEQGIGGMGNGNAVPEPSSLGILGLGLCLIAGIALIQRRSSNAVNEGSLTI